MRGKKVRLRLGLVPSATVVMPSALPSCSTALMMSRSLRLFSSQTTKDRSILIVSTGKLRRCDSDEKPVPKSSSATVIPAPRSVPSAAIAVGTRPEKRCFGDLQLYARCGDAMALQTL